APGRGTVRGRPELQALPGGRVPRAHAHGQGALPRARRHDARGIAGDLRVPRRDLSAEVAVSRRPAGACQGTGADRADRAACRARGTQALRPGVLRQAGGRGREAIGREGPRQGHPRVARAGEIRPVHRRGRAQPRRLHRFRQPAARVARDEARLRARLPGGDCAAEALFENARGASCFQAGQRRSQGSDGWREKVSAFKEYLRYRVRLTAVLDPFLAVPIFLSVTSAANPAGRRRLADIVTLTVFAVLAGSALFGEGLLRLIGDRKSTRLNSSPEWM